MVGYHYVTTGSMYSNSNGYPYTVSVSSISSNGCYNNPGYLAIDLSEFEKFDKELNRKRLLRLSIREGERPTTRPMRSQSLPRPLQARLLHHTAMPRRVA